MSFTLLHRRFIPIFLLLTIAACSVPEEEDPDIVVTLEPEFIVDLFEYRNPGDGAAVFGLWVESVKDFDCGNYRIEADVDVTSDEINISLQEILVPDTCMGTPAPARGFLPIGKLADGTYRFCFSLNPVITNEGTLEVQGGHYALSLPKQQGIDFQNRVLELLPDGYVWGYANTPAEQDLPVADQFLQNLKSVTQEPALPPGYYSYFTVSGTDQYFFHRSIAPGGQYRPFLRYLGGTPDAVEGVLQGYRSDPDHPLEILCLSTFGRL